MKISIEITKKNITPISVWFAWSAILLFCVSLIIGSYNEHEPYAGNMFGLIALAWACLAIPIWLWQRNRLPRQTRTE
ncbi:hypothetical protein [Pseudodesulfovibrio indicus]|uniref:hypothetical protein n=1 Tax=Pseudodesulfovibrio indicus TaxID=1716143 RepID=UPI0010644DB1|nr:hypothetical protein [Pseudodesulfovibrio indicus]